MKIRLDDVMQSFSYPFEAVYYYYIPLETVLMFAGGVIYGKAVNGIATEEDVEKRAGDFIRLPRLGEEGRRKVMKGFLDVLPAEGIRERLKQVIETLGPEHFEHALREEKVLIAWYNYRDEVYSEFAKRWCEANGLDLIM